MAIIYVFIDPTIRVEHTVKVLAYFSADIILSVAHNSNNIALTWLGSQQFDSVRKSYSRPELQQTRPQYSLHLSLSITNHCFHDSRFMVLIKLQVSPRC